MFQTKLSLKSEDKIKTSLICNEVFLAVTYENLPQKRLNKNIILPKESWKVGLPPGFINSLAQQWHQGCRFSPSLHSYFCYWFYLLANSKINTNVPDAISRHNSIQRKLISCLFRNKKTFTKILPEDFLNLIYLGCIPCSFFK